MRTAIRHFAFVLAVGLVLAGVLYAVRGPQGWPSMMESRRRVAEMEKGNEALRQQIEKMKRDNERLRSDPEAQEQAIREYTHKQKPGETTIYLPSVPKN